MKIGDQLKRSQVILFVARNVVKFPSSRWCKSYQVKQGEIKKTLFQKESYFYNNCNYSLGRISRSFINREFRSLLKGSITHHPSSIIYPKIPTHSYSQPKHSKKRERERVLERQRRQPGARVAVVQRSNLQLVTSFL